MQRKKSYQMKSCSVTIPSAWGCTQRFGPLWSVWKLEERGMEGGWGMLDWR